MVKFHQVFVHPENFRVQYCGSRISFHFCNIARNDFNACPLSQHRAQWLNFVCYAQYPGIRISLYVYNIARNNFNVPTI